MEKRGAQQTFVKQLFLPVSLSLIVFLLSACHAGNGTVTTTLPGSETGLRRLAVFPFVRVAPEDAHAGGAVRCPICGVFIKAEESPAASETAVQTLLVNRLERAKKFEILPPDRIEGMLRRVTAADALRTPTAQLLRKAGKELEADGVVVGYIYRFREREGVAYSVKRPASVAYEIHLVRVSDGAHLWRGVFDKTQTSLMENLLQISWFFRERGRWVTATAFADEGMEELLKTFPGMP